MMQNAAMLWPLPLIAGGNRKRILRRRLSRIARDGARVHSLKPYGFADFTALVVKWNRIFFDVFDFFEKGSCFCSTMLGHMERCRSFRALAPRRWPLLLRRDFFRVIPANFLEENSKAAHQRRGILIRARYLDLRRSDKPLQRAHSQPERRLNFNC